MDLARKTFDSSYNLLKPFLFFATREDPEIAHDGFLLFSKILMATKLEKFALDNKTNYKKHPFEISNAAGLDKNAEIPPQFFKYLGLDRVNYGTITGEDWSGNLRPRTRRIVEKESFINNIGWENDGSEVISNRMKSHKNYEVSITISIGYTPNPELNIEERLKDLKKTLNQFNHQGIQCIDRVEYNPSCGNLSISRKENQELLKIFVPFIKSHINPRQELNIKTSPDLDEKEIDCLIKDTYDFVDGYVIANATKQRSYGGGSASGDILYSLSLETQKKFYERLKNIDKKITACGGINSRERVMERIEFEPQKDKRIQILTPFFFKGPRFLREIKS